MLNSNSSAPVINNYISVENLTNTTCFDAVIFPVKDIIMVDCAIHLSSKDSRGFSYQNLFYFFKISDGSKIGTLENEMYIAY